MKSKKIIYILLPFVLVNSFSCKDGDEYRVDDEFALYVARFEEEALKRGMNLNLKSSGLIMEFADLDDDKAGLCHYENPIRIEIDREYWKNTSGRASTDFMREDLIFHELGHGILGRKHINTTLANGDWKSMMCGGTKVDNRPWNINYRGFRREYYINELFKESTPAPELTSLTFTEDTTGFQSKVFLSFDSEKKEDMGWNVANTDSYSISIDNKRMKFVSGINLSYLILANTSVDVLSDFMYEISLECQPVNTGDQYGIVFGSSDDSGNDVDFFSIANTKKMYMGNRRWYSFFTELNISAIKENTENKLTVMKKNGMLYYFVNDVYVYCSESELNTAGSQFGFIVPARGVLWLNNFRVKTKGTDRSKIGAIQFSDFETRLVPVENLGKVKN
ncbi:MAG: hypothetical protein H6Q20_1519 [Bacteroidetes bacterium]|nr:hypothetical protein [Bacteroidota bacterium]